MTLSRSTILAIDPGKTGALAFIDDMGAHMEDMPDSPAALADIIRNRKCDIRHAFIECVHAMPGQGVTSMFTFGRRYGEILGILAAFLIPVTLVQPNAWKKHHGILKADKDAARSVAARLFPACASELSRKKDIGRADALLIGAYGMTTAYHNKREEAA